MTLDEAIRHCEEVAEKNETQAQKIGRQLVGSAIDKYATDCRQCAADHRQFAEWLQELKELKAKPVKHGRWIGVDYDTYFECSECKHMTDWQNYKYCPYCGARMDGDKE